MLGINAVGSAEAVSSDGWDVVMEQAVVVRCAANGEFFVAVGRERVAVVAVYVNTALGAQRRHWRCIPIKFAF